MKKLLLLTNDDGHTSPGLRALWPVLDEVFETIVIAPKRQRSWIGKAISNPGPLTLEQEMIDGKQIYVLDDGMPADCTNIGLFHVCPRKPDLVISGINPGPNFTSSLALSSGTVGAALEAAQNGVLGLAVSLNPDPSLFWQLEAKHEDGQIQYYEQAAEVVLEVAKHLVATPLPAEIKVINLVIPQVMSQPAKIVPCVPLPYEYGSVFVRKGNQFHNRTIGFIPEQAHITPHSDVWVAQQGWIALTAYTGRLEICTDSEIGIEL
jgi:5'-nucleotidase